MTNFSFGSSILPPVQEIIWNPDSTDCSNPHMAISGESGSGKSTLLRSIVTHLAIQKKHIYVMDLHGDLSIDDDSLENSIEFRARKSHHGINPFEFETEDIDNGGVGVNIASMVTMIKKAFLPSMGAKQESVLRQLIKDTYKLKGIVDEDEKTWSKELPSMETLLSLVDELIKYHSNNGASIATLLQKMDRQRRKLKELDYADYFKQAVAEAMLGTDAIEKIVIEYIEHHNKNANKGDIKIKPGEHNDIERNFEGDELNKFIDDLYDGYGTEHTNKILAAYKSIHKTSGELDFLTNRYRKYCQYGSHSEMFGATLPEEIDPENYESKDVIKTLETLKIYIGSITTSGIFNDSKPPIKPGLNRLDISGLPDELKSFFVDTFVSKIFRAVRLRGDYIKRGDFRRGNLVDTYIVIDEGRTILPSGKDKDDHRQIINRVMNEARKFGLGLVFVSQTPSHYSTAILSAYTKVILKTQENEIAKSMKLLGVKERSQYAIIERKMAALIGTGSTFIPVGLDGYKRPQANNDIDSFKTTVDNDKKKSPILNT